VAIISRKPLAFLFHHGCVFLYLSLLHSKKILPHSERLHFGTEGVQRTAKSMTQVEKTGGYGKVEQ